MMQTLSLSKGFTAVVDDDDFERLARFGWHAHISGKRTYARAAIKGKKVYLHRFVLGSPVGCVDHIDGNTLNNQKSNLRCATKAENNRNRRASKNRTFKGVFAQVGGYMARIVVDRRPIYLGYFKDQVAAARAYDAAAIKEFGEFAQLNFPSGI
jgi:hypothetical protein